VFRFFCVSLFLGGGGTGDCRIGLSLVAMFQRELTNPQKFRNAIYNIFMKRTSTYVTSLIVSGFIGMHVMNRTVENIWASRNAGKTFEDIHKTFPHLQPEDDD